MSLKSPFAVAIERGGYSAIAYKDGDLYVAEDNLGNILEESATAATTLQAAIDGLPSAGGKVLMDGVFPISTAVNFTKDKVTLEGMGISTKLSTTSNITMLSLSSKNNCIIRDMHIYGSGVANTSNTAISLTGSSENIIEDAIIENVGGYAAQIQNASHKNMISSCILKSGRGEFLLDGSTADCQRNIIKNCVIDTLTRHGIRILECNYNILKGLNIRNTGASYDGIIISGENDGNRNANHNVISNCIVKECQGTRGIYVLYADETSIANCDISDNVNNGLFLENSDYVSVTGGNVSDNGGLTDNNIHLSNIKHTTINGVILKNPGQNAIEAYQCMYCSFVNLAIKACPHVGICICASAGTESSYNVISGCTVLGNTQHGLMVYNSGTGICDGNIIVGNTVKDCDVGNTATYDGIYVANNSDHTIIANNRCIDNDRNQIRIDHNTCNKTLIHGNICICSDCVGTISDAGTGTVQADNITT